MQMRAGDRLLGVVRTDKGENIGVVLAASGCYFHGRDDWKCQGKAIRVGALTFCEESLVDLVQHAFVNEYLVRNGRRPRYTTNVRTGDIVETERLGL
jgi:hypothetical protein